MSLTGRHKPITGAFVPVGTFAYEALRAVLQRFAGRAIVDGMLSTACRHAGVTPQTVKHADLRRLIDELTPSVRTLCATIEVPEALKALNDLITSPPR